jgi:hypothetical protein
MPHSAVDGLYWPCERFGLDKQICGDYLAIHLPLVSSDTEWLQVCKPCPEPLEGFIVLPFLYDAMTVSYKNGISTITY